MQLGLDFKPRSRDVYAAHILLVHLFIWEYVCTDFKNKASNLSTSMIQFLYGRYIRCSCTLCGAALASVCVATSYSTVRITRVLYPPQSLRETEVGALSVSPLGCVIHCHMLLLFSKRTSVPLVGLPTTTTAATSSPTASMYGMCYSHCHMLLLFSMHAVRMIYLDYKAVSEL